MAKGNGVWGIDIGQSGLKALRCTIQDGEVVADAFDYIEYPKILSQPEAEPEKLVQEALQQFLSRNSVKGDKIAISVPGQSGLAKFFKPPPVDAKKIPDIVKYEARQQIPFALEDVIWDYQQMGGGAEVDGFALETEVGLFAMKREQVYRAIRPFQEAGLELDIVQLAPLSIYNFVSHDLLDGQADVEEFDPDNPPESLVILSMGTDTTDLIITNGFRLWQRSIPLGGNHFTKQLTKELKLTFAKAEHLKRNARQSEDPKAVFQAMRPIFQDMVTEVQRSVNFFQSIDRKAKIRGVLLMGNTVKLPGLKSYLSKNLGYDIVDFSSFSKLSGPSVLSAPAFKDNLMAFGVCYGLCLQGLDEAKLSTNLVPRELLTERMVREKKPWVVACVAVLLLACMANFFFHFGAYSSVAEDRAVNNVSWKAAEQRVDSVSSTSSSFEREDSDRVAKMAHLKAIGAEVVGDADRRLLWMELLKALNQTLPRTPGLDPRKVPDPKQVPFGKRRELYIKKVETEYFPDLTTWFTDPVKARYLEARQLHARPAPAEGEDAAATDGSGAAEVTGPEGEGWVVELDGYHYFNENLSKGAAEHVRNTLLRSLKFGEVQLPVPPHLAAAYELPLPPNGHMTFTMEELGISHPTLVRGKKPQTVQIPNPKMQGLGSGAGGLGGEEMMGEAPGGFGAAPTTGRRPNQNQKKKEDQTEEEPTHFEAKKYDFIVQFCWQPKLLSERLEAKKQQMLEQQRQQEELAQRGEETVAANLDGGR